MRRAALGLGMLALGCTASDAGTVAPQPGAEPQAAVAIAPPAAGPRAKLDRSQVICDRAIRCGTIGRSQRDECLRGEGVSRLTLVWGSRAELGIDALVQQGRLIAAPADEQACLEFLSIKSSCRDDLRAAPKGCGATGPADDYAPAVKPGGACIRWEECIDGFCTAQAGGDPGVCVRRSHLGEACHNNQICTDDSFCWEGTCRARAGAGETCLGHWQWCQDGLFCDGWAAEIENDHHARPETAGVCRGPRQLGEGCVPPGNTSGEICGPGLFCDWGDAAPVCRAPLPAGAECRWLDACADGLACAGLVLGDRHPIGTRYGVRRPGRCVAILDVGDACDPAAFVSGCAASLTCDAKTRVCRSRGHAGDPCESSWVMTPPKDDAPLRVDGCFSGHFCDIATRTCQRQLARGARCKPPPSGEDNPCFLSDCEPQTGRCVSTDLKRRKK